VIKSIGTKKDYFSMPRDIVDRGLSVLHSFLSSVSRLPALCFLQLIWIVERTEPREARR